MRWLMIQYAGYLIAAALVGLAVGWLVWARSAKRAQASFEARAKEMRAELMARRQETAANSAELERLRRVAGPAAGRPADATPQGFTGGAADDLTRIEGVGPKMAAALGAAGITTFADIAGAADPALTAALKAAGMRFAPSLGTWAAQARYLVDGDEAGFAEYTGTLVAGREPGSE